MNNGKWPRTRPTWHLLSLSVAAFVTLSVGLSHLAFAQPQAGHPGASVYKKSGCIVCHKWHGMGGPGYGGTPINFRENFLTKKQLIEVIACGRPATGMPYHRKEAYEAYECYEGLTKEDLGADDMPGKSRNLLSARQISNVASFIIDHFEGRDNALLQSDCAIFFGKSRMCRDLESAGGGGGGGGH